MVHKCWERYNPVFVGVEEKSAGAATTSPYGVDTNWQSNWHIDSGATDHITGDLHKLTIRDKYNDNDQVYTASGSGMDISHIGHSVVSTSGRDVYLKNILHVPQASKSLLSALLLIIMPFSKFTLTFFS
jgi:hypothetical protein